MFPFWSTDDLGHLLYSMRKNGLQVVKAVVRDKNSAGMQKKEKETSIFKSCFNKSTKIKHVSDIFKVYQHHTFLIMWEPQTPSIRNTESKEEKSKFKLNENRADSENSNGSPNISTSNSDSKLVRRKEDNYKAS